MVLQEVDLPIGGAGQLASGEAFEEALDFAFVACTEVVTFQQSVRNRLALAGVQLVEQELHVPDHVDGEGMVPLGFPLGLQDLQFRRIHDAGRDQRTLEPTDALPRNQAADQPQDGLGEQAEQQGDDQIESGVEQGQVNGSVHGAISHWGQEPRNAVEDPMQDGQGEHDAEDVDQKMAQGGPARLPARHKGCEDHRGGRSDVGPEQHDRTAPLGHDAPCGERDDEGHHGG